MHNQNNHDDSDHECSNEQDWKGRDPTQVDVMSLAHIIDLAGQLLNK